MWKFLLETFNFLIHGLVGNKQQFGGAMIENIFEVVVTNGWKNRSCWHGHLLGTIVHKIPLW